MNLKRWAAFVVTVVAFMALLSALVMNERQITKIDCPPVEGMCVAYVEVPEDASTINSFDAYLKDFPDAMRQLGVYAKLDYSAPAKHKFSLGGRRERWYIYRPSSDQLRAGAHDPRSIGMVALTGPMTDRTEGIKILSITQVQDVRQAHP